MLGAGMGTIAIDVGAASPVVAGAFTIQAVLKAAANTSDGNVYDGYTATLQ